MTQNQFTSFNPRFSKAVWGRVGLAGGAALGLAQHSHVEGTLLGQHPTGMESWWVWIFVDQEWLWDQKQQQV